MMGCVSGIGVPTRSSISHKSQSNSTSPHATACVHGACGHLDEEDPLGLLHRSYNDSFRKGRTHSSGFSGLGSSGPETGGAISSTDCCACDGENPLEVIDAVLRRSRAVRDQVSSRQAVILDSYRTESHQLDKELSLLPPTYTKYRAARDRVNMNRRRQRPVAKAAKAKTSPSIVSHPLNFHLHGSHSNAANDSHSAHVGETCPRSEPHGAEAQSSEPERIRALKDDDRELQTGGQSHMGWENFEHDQESSSECGEDGSLDEGAAVSSGQEKAGDEGAGDRGATKRFSTLARVGSFEEEEMARSLQTPLQLHRERTSGEGDVPALRRSKVRGRQMVFSLLEAARIEEKDMEEILMSCPVSAIEEGRESTLREAASRNLNQARRRNARELEALMAEYDPRPRSSRSRCTFNNFRKSLPRQMSSLAIADGDRKKYPPSGRRATITSYLADEDGKGRGEEYDEDSASHDSYYADGLRRGDRRDKPGGRGGSGDGLEGVKKERQWGLGAASPFKQFDIGWGEGGAVRGGDDPIGGVARSGDVVVDAGGDGEATVDDGSRDEGLPPETSPLTAPTGPTGLTGRTGRTESIGATSCGAEGSLPNPVAALPGGACEELVVESDRPGRGVGGNVVSMMERSATTGKPKKPTLPDPNEVNDFVMTDPFNMDHMKDLPGLVGGDNRWLSRLVSETVSYTDPAFPNLEFYRRAAMDRAGYFMPGYKPQVVSPGSDAGAYWLERRQSYRVKMSAPPHPGGASNGGGGRKKRRPQRRSSPKHASK